MELVFTDAEVRRFYRNQHRRQLSVIAQLRQRREIKERTREDDAIHLFTTERVNEAIAQGELQTLGLNRDAVVENNTSRKNLF